MVDDDFTGEQRAVLDAMATRRVTVVRAGPGSGKTRVFVEALRRELKSWDSPRAGVAALSFTNAAHEVISQRLGGTPPAPHFVGTLDGFLLRFVVRPFAKLVGVHPDVRLVPEVLAKKLERPRVQCGSKVWQNVPIFLGSFVGGDEVEPEIQVPDRRGLTALPTEARTRFFEAKKRDWGSTGRVTHSDSQFLASCILMGQFGPQVAATLSRRFPVLLLDEFQDTGWFHGRATMQLLKVVRRALVVGDPDQAIYQFAGASSGAFDEVAQMDGAEVLTLEESHRCAARVATVASALSRSQKSVRAREGAPAGETMMLVYQTPSLSHAAALRAARKHLTAYQSDRTALLVRRLRDGDEETDHPWKPNSVAGRICSIVATLRDGSAREATAMLSTELGRLLLDNELPTASRLEALKVDPRRWRRGVGRLLLAAESWKEGETWNGWIRRLKVATATTAEELGRSAAGLGPKFTQNHHKGHALRPRRSVLSTTRSAPVETVLTIHGAKGREFETVVLLVAKPHAKNAPCPSIAWWGGEEREVAYVACSRARVALCLAVHVQTYRALVAKRPDFVRLFQTIMLDSDAALSQSRKRQRRSTSQPTLPNM